MPPTAVLQKVTTIAADGTQMPSFAVVDGKQRLMTFQMFMDGHLAVPASWSPRRQGNVH